MAVIADDAHAVAVSTVSVVVKAASVQPPPFESSWYLMVQSTGGTPQSLHFSTEEARDEFFKKLIEAMGAV